MIEWFYFGNDSWQKVERFIEITCVDRVGQLGIQFHRRPSISDPVAEVVAILRGEGLLSPGFPEKVYEMDRDQALALATILLMADGVVPQDIDAHVVQRRAASLANGLRNRAADVETVARYLRQIPG